MLKSSVINRGRTTITYGNKSQRETDYSGVGVFPLRFVRTCNIRAARVAGLISGFRVEMESDTINRWKGQSMSSTLFLRSAGLIALMIALQLTQVVSATEAKKPNRRCVNVGENLEGSRGVDELTAMVVDSFRKSDFRGVEGYAADWGDLSCIWKDGRPRLSAIEYGLSRAISQEPDWLKTEAMITQYRQQYPESPIAVMAEVEFWTNYAWKARGTGYADSVTQENQNLMTERLKKAERLLIDTRQFSAKTPIWHSKMIVVQKGLGRPLEDSLQVFSEGVKKFPTYYSIYFELEQRMMPWWGGNWQAVEDFAVQSSKSSNPLIRSSLYARLYWSANGPLVTRKTTLFKETKVSWPRMKQSFDDLVKLTPDSKWNRANYLSFACQADDKLLFLALRKKIADLEIDVFWPKVTPLDACEEKFGFMRKQR